MTVLSNRTSFWTAAAVVALALWASGAPAMVYPLYAAEWNLTPTIITMIFAVYPISLVVTMVIFGAISDYIGRRATLLAGVIAMAAGILLFAVAPNVGWLFAGRAFQGIGVGLALSPASAAMVEFNPGGRSARASSINTAATAVGLALATLVGGALVQYAFAPLHLSYWVLFVLAVATASAIWFMPRGVTGTTASGRWRPQPVAVPRGLGLVFAVSALAISAGFSGGALLLSLGSQIAKDLIQTDNAFVAGSIISVPAVVTGIIALLGRRIPPRTSIAIGGIANATGMGLIVVSAAQASLPLFLVAWIIGGSGYGLLFLGGLGLTNRHAPAHHRAQMLSVVYLAAYLSQGLAAIAVGLSDTAIGLAPAVDIWAPIIGGMCLLASLLALLSGGLRRVAVAS
jgi:hypothetical protein